MSAERRRKKSRNVSDKPFTKDHARDVFDTNPFKEPPGPTYRRPSAKPKTGTFQPTNPSRTGTIGPYPSHSADAYNDKPMKLRSTTSTTDRDTGVFRPTCPAKETPTPSVLRRNVDKDAKTRKGCRSTTTTTATTTAGATEKSSVSERPSAVPNTTKTTTASYDKSRTTAKVVSSHHTVTATTAHPIPFATASHSLRTRTLPPSLSATHSRSYASVTMTTHSVVPSLPALPPPITHRHISTTISNLTQ